MKGYEILRCQDKQELAKILSNNLSVASDLATQLKALEYEGVKLKWHKELADLLNNAFLANMVLSDLLKEEGAL